MRIGEMRAERVQQTSEMDKMVMNSIWKNLQYIMMALIIFEVKLHSIELVF